MRTLLLLFLFSFTTALWGQRVLLIEKVNSPRTTKIYTGDYIQYQVVGEEDWFGDQIYELRDDVQAIVFPDRYVPISDISMMRQGRPWARNLGYMLMTFGVAWSGFAAIGTLTDGDPDSNYRWSDAAVTGISVGTGLLLPALFGTRRLRFGENQSLRLRIIDISF